MEVIDIKEFDKIIKEKTMLVCGNGLSTNFDSGYSKIYDRLYNTQKKMMKKHRIVAISKIKI